MLKSYPNGVQTTVRGHSSVLVHLENLTRKIGARRFRGEIKRGKSRAQARLQSATVLRSYVRKNFRNLLDRNLVKLVLQVRLYQ